VTRRAAGAARLLALVIALCLSVLACAGSAGGTPGPDAPCGGLDEQRAPGFYPDLEALVPRTLPAGGAVEGVESGRYCSARTLGSLRQRGIEELRFAGGQVTEARDRGLGVSVYRADGLDLDALADSFANGAGDARRVSAVLAREISVGGRRAIRIEANVRRFTVQQRLITVVWESRESGSFRAVFATGIEEARLTRTLEALADA
jgi:hypothetical protein